MGGDDARSRGSTDHLETLYSSTRAYRRYRATATGNATDAVPVAEIDVFLLRQVAALYPQIPAVMDLAADATHGASAAVWAECTGVSRVFLARAGGGEGAGGSEEFFRRMAEAGLDADTYRCLDTPPVFPAPPGASADGTGGQRWDRDPVFCVLAASEAQATELIARLRRLTEDHPDALVWVLHVGGVGESRILGTLLAQLGEMPDYRLYLPREISPFLHTSRLALVARRDNAAVADVLARVAQFYGGNFQFLALVEASIEAAQREAELRARLERLEQDGRDADVYRLETGYRREEYEQRVREYEQRASEYEQRVREKDRHILALEERANYLEQTFLPWKESYIAGLEQHIQNLNAGALRRASNAVRRVVRVVRRQ